MLRSGGVVFDEVAEEMETHQAITSLLPPNPCLSRPNHPARRASPLTVFFVHVPKTAGTLRFRFFF